MSDKTEGGRFVDLAVEVVSAYLRNNYVRAELLPDLIGSVHRTRDDLETRQGVEATPAPQVKATAQEIRRSIAPEYLVSFEDGRQYKTLGRRLRARN